MAETLSDLVRRFEQQAVAVVGDVMLDHFLVGRVERISPEAPVPVVQFDHDEYRLGGAGNVAHNIAALGAEARLVGVVGDDAPAREICRALADARLNAAGLVTDGSRPTTRKVRVVTSRNQQVARVDYERAADLDAPALQAVLSRLSDASRHAGAIVLSDYRKGVVTNEVIGAACQLSKQTGAVLLVDPKVPQPDRYRGVGLITPNHNEAELMTQMPIRTEADCRRAARLLGDRTGASVLITWGEHGMWVLDRSGDELREAALPAAAREVADVTGAGDTVIAVLALALASGAPLVDAARLANMAAGLVVARFGPVAVTPGALIDALTRSPA
jgi:D-beta-D-heptose 7-phosphate kinase/D-beta-D-heptose 1-phosphate adenosyltransferase